MPSTTPENRILQNINNINELSTKCKSRKDTNRAVVCLIDMDCFYCQVEEKLEPSLIGKPVAVVQYNAWQGGGIIAVNYAARACGVTRHMRGDEAKKHCPAIELVSVPSVREKADLTKYREAGKEVAVVLQKNTTLLERASVDEAYLDITERVEDRLKLVNSGEFQLRPETLGNTYAVGYEELTRFVNLISDAAAGKVVKAEADEEEEDDEEEEEFLDEETKSSNLRLLIGATIVNEIRAQVKEETGYECSAGIAHNKILAKLACGINKPNKQTVLPLREIPKLFETLAINKIRGLGGKFGEIVCETLKVKYMGDLVRYTERELQGKFDEKNGSWLYLMCRGIDLDPVTPKYTSKSIGCCKKFPGKNAIKGLTSLTHWLTELATEINDRLEKDQEENNRRAQLLTVSFMQSLNGEDISSSRSVSLDSYDIPKIAGDAFECIKKNTDQFLCLTVPGNVHNPIKFLGLSVGKFEKNPSNRNRIQEMFKLQQVKVKEIKVDETVPEKKVEVKEVEVKEKSVNPEKTSFFHKYLKKIAIDEGKEALELKQTEPTEKQALEINETNKTATKMEITTSYSKETAPNPSKADPAYLTEYAEFFGQGINMEEFTKVCPKCNKRVANYEYESHMDFHMAMELSNEQRMEHRATLQKRDNPSESKSGEKKKKVTATITSGQILKYTQNKDNLAKNPVPETTNEPQPQIQVIPEAKMSFFQKYNSNQIEKAKEALAVDPNRREEAQVNELNDLITEMEEDSELDDSNREMMNETLGDPFDESTLPLDGDEINPESFTATQTLVKPSETSSYTTEYAEFFAQNINLDDFMKVCPQCQVKVRNYEYESHMDFHLAMELSQQQRVEYRAALQSKKDTKPVPQSPKPSSKGSTKSATITSSQILKYLQKDPEQTSLLCPNTEICLECGKAIPLDKVLEHSDLHVAKKLHLQLMRQETTSVVTKTSSPIVPKKRKTATGQGKPISSFFRDNV